MSFFSQLLSLSRGRQRSSFQLSPSSRRRRADSCKLFSNSTRGQSRWALDRKGKLGWQCNILLISLASCVVMSLDRDLNATVTEILVQPGSQQKHLLHHDNSYGSEKNIHQIWILDFGSYLKERRAGILQPIKARQRLRVLSHQLDRAASNRLNVYNNQL